MENKYTSLNLSKKLAKAGCMLESSSEKGYNGIMSSCDGESKLFYPAYDILNDICVKYAIEVFGEEEVKITIKQNGNIVKLEESAHIYNPKQVLELLQKGQKQEAEDYIWKHTIFNKGDKDEK